MNVREEFRFKSRFRFRVKKFQMRSDLWAVSNAHISSDRGCEHGPPRFKVFYRGMILPLAVSFALLSLGILATISKAV